MKYIAYNQIQPNDGHNLRLLQLNPEIIKSIREEELIQIKSSKNESDLVLVNDSQTWRMRQMNQTNTVLLLEVHSLPIPGDSLSDETIGRLIGKQEIPSQYELTLIPGRITYDLPIYEGPESETGDNYTIDDLLDDSPCSKDEFFKHWHDLGGCEIKGNVYKLSDNLLKTELDKLITIIISQGIDYLSGTDTFPGKLIQSKLGQTVLNKFATKCESQDTYRLDNASIAKFYGLKTLKAQALGIKQFYLEWKSIMPPFYNVPLNILSLGGHFYKQQGVLIYLDSSKLSRDFGMRVNQLLKLADQWDLADIEPFLAPLTDRKVESVLLKFAKVKTVDKQKIVIKR